MRLIRWYHDAGETATLILDAPTQSATTMTEPYAPSLRETLDRLEAEKESITGVVITSAKKTFFAGGDLNELLAVDWAGTAEYGDFGRTAKSQLRRLETLGRPVVAAINGTALGGGLEICLAAHYR